MSETASEVLTRLTAGFDSFLAALDAGPPAEEVLAVLQRFEAFRNQLPLADHRLIALMEQHSIAEQICQGSVAKAVDSRLRVGFAEACRRVRAAAALSPRTSMLGEPLPPQRPCWPPPKPPGRSAWSRWRSSNAPWPASTWSTPAWSVMRRRP